MTRRQPVAAVEAASSRRALLGGAGALLAGSGAARGVSAPHPSLPHPDAALIALCDRHVRNMHTYNAGCVADGYTDGPLWATYERTLHAIDDAEPVTLAGVAAVARAMLEDGSNPNGIPQFREEWVQIIADGVLRLNGGAA